MFDAGCDVVIILIPFSLCNAYLKINKILFAVQKKNKLAPGVLILTPPLLLNGDPSQFLSFLSLQNGEVLRDGMETWRRCSFLQSTVWNDLQKKTLKSGKEGKERMYVQWEKRGRRGNDT